VQDVKCPRCEATITGDSDYCPECDTYLGSSDETVMLLAEDGGDTGVESPDNGNGQATEITETFATRGPISAGDREIDETIVPSGPEQAEDEESDETILTTGPGPASIPSFGGWSEPGAPPTGTLGATGTLEAGRTLGNRYEILQMLGRGGMGAVYKARDVELDRMVALKVIRPELASDPEILQRFKQEIILARDVTHRNIIRIYDLGQADGIKFLSMEFVEGKDLHAILKEKGPLPVEEAVEIMEQVCFALEEAHETGVVHRDLKPQNIMIGPDGRVVVMDFGIARSVQVTGMTQTGSVLGTPDYMSPEQVKGQQADARSDIFALGVIFFEILTGEKPYKGDSPMATMYKRTQDRAKSVREVNPEVPGFIGDVIARCLEIQPQKRFQSARELVHDLEIYRGGTPGTMHMTMRHIKALPRRTSKKPLLIGAALLLAILAVIIGVMVIPRGAPEVPEQVVVAPEDVTSLAILPFTNTSGDASTAWLSSGLTDMLLTDIGQSAYLRTVSPDRMHQILRDLGLSGVEELDASDRRQIAEYANADKLIWGQYLKLGDQIRIDATVEDVAQQIRTPVKVEVDDESELLGAVGDLALLVRENLELSADQLAGLEDQVQRPSSDSVVAIRHYLQGLELIRQGNNLDAVTEFEAAVGEDPEFALAHSKLATAKFVTGHGDQAVASSRRALELSEDLPPQERNVILAEDARVRGDLEQGITAYESLLRYRPNDPDLLYELGVLYENEGLFDRAQENYQRVLKADPQNLAALLASGRALAAKGDAAAALEPLNRALSQAIQLGNREAEANVLQSLGMTYRQLNRLDDALESHQESLAIKQELGDKRGMAASLRGISWVQELMGNWDAARSAYQSTIDLNEEIGDRHGLGITLMNFGEMERTLGNYEEALQLARQAHRIQVEMNDELNQGASLNNIGAIYFMQGKYDDALVYYQRALEIRERLNAPVEVATTLHNLGETYATMGRYDEALEKYLRSLELQRDLGDQGGAAYESLYMSRVFVQQGRYRAALEAAQQAVETYQELQDESGWYLEALAWNGEVLNLLNHREEATPIVEQAVSLAEEWGDPWLLTQTLNIEGDGHFYRGDFAAAGLSYARAEAVASESGDPLWELTSRVNRATALTAQGEAAQAVSLLEAASKDASTLGLNVLGAETEIHLGTALLASGQNQRGREILDRALKDARDLVPPDIRARGHAQLAEALDRAGQTEAAAEHTSRVTVLLDDLVREAGDDRIRGRADLEPLFSNSVIQ
jgi:tetratricopeptide (TPR) repeat protein/predicted Ser/Thr protein kinase